MKTGITDLWIRTRESYWFIPGLLSVAAVVAAFVLVRIDYMLGEAWLEKVPWLRINQAESAQAVLSTIAGSIITVAGVTFSMTLLAVSHATAQFGAHLLTAFMRDRANQFTLGIFIATFIYCLSVLRSVSSSEQANAGATAEFIPQIAVNGAFLLAVLCVAVLIFFIHHVPQSINVTHVIAKVGDDLIATIRTLYPEQTEDEGSQTGPSINSQRNVKPEVIVAPDPGGYLRIVDFDGLINAASQADLVIELRKRPGDFALPGEALVQVWGQESPSDSTRRSLQNCFSWGSERTTSQDVLLPVQQLLEIAGRALSPGVNNQYIALLCIDQLGRGMHELCSRMVPDARSYDQHGQLRVIANAISHEQFLDSLARPLLQYVHDDEIACRRTTEILHRIGELSVPKRLREKLKVIAGHFDQHFDNDNFPAA